MSVDLMLYSPFLDRKEKINLLGESVSQSDHSCPQRLLSFWSAPRIATSGWVRFFEHAQKICFVL